MSKKSWAHRGIPPVRGKYGSDLPATTATSTTNIYYGGNYMPAISRPTDTIDRTKLSIVLFKQSWLDKMSAVCQPAAGESEFQIHYRALQVKIKTDSNEIIFSVPLYFYNFTQTVTSGSVNYHLNDMEAEAKKGDEIISWYVDEALKQYPIIAAATSIYPNASVEFLEVDSGSLHRHPGRFGFSTIDYDKNPTNPGVIYREAEATDKVHTDSVIYLGKNTEIYTTETRILNLAKDGQGVKGTYCQIPTITYVLKDNVDATPVLEAKIDQFADILMGYATDVDREPTDNAKNYCVVASMNASTRTYKLVNEILEDFIGSTLEPSMENVVADRISQRGYAGYGYGYGTSNTVTYGNSGKKRKTSVVYEDDEYDEDGWYGAYGSYGVVNKVSKDTNPYPVGSKAWKNWNKD